MTNSTLTTLGPPSFSDSLDFTGKTVLVVGGSSGIGNGIAQAFRQLGAQVHAWGTRARASDYSADEGSDLSGLHYAQVDVSDQAAVNAAQPAFERLDVLVLAQGTILYKRAEFEMAAFDQVLRVNLSSTMACALKFQPMLRESRGSLITLSSIAGFRSVRGNPAYAASKSGVVGLTRTLGEAWAPDGIRVNGIAPGLVDTKLTKVTTNSPARLDAALSRVPLGRMGLPQEIAGTAVFLASPLASYMVGQTLVADGGLTLA
ncbi:SDR family NAD(P)-dependent oxidoreductase [Cupriavidus sp. IDO]|uniref:SDR family NAD(P)-dependent oxidoreductase n=1 Tax=Cupriavidus sp. IDO TaxID=1539142 RepID=UPI00068DEE99|nr:SDR family oxidoreductase [Cupriavidus sp. IDO]KWR75060.1 3-oxoacyl-ACP reductase [Cupriavidus sp. IDO]